MASRNTARSNIQQFILSLGGFPDNVLEAAVCEYQKLDIPVPRSENRSKIICYCICQAYVRLDQPAIDPAYVGSKLGLTPAQSNLAVKNRPKYKAGEKSISPTVDIIDMLKIYSKDRLDLPEDIVISMVVVLSQLLDAAPYLVGSQAKPLVIAFIYAYITKNSMTVNKNDLLKLSFIENRRLVDQSLLEIEAAMTSNSISF